MEWKWNGKELMNSSDTTNASPNLIEVLIT